MEFTKRVNAMNALTGTQALDKLCKLSKKHVASTLHSRDAKHCRVNDQIRALVKSFQCRWNAGPDLLPRPGRLARQCLVEDSRWVPSWLALDV